MSCPAPVGAETALADRLFEATIHTLELFGVYLGKRLGLYAVLRDHGSLSSVELAARAGIAERYAREWLEQQAVAGLLRVDAPGVPATARRYRLPAEHTGPLADETSPAHVAPFAQMVAGIGGALEQVVAAYRSGGGVPYTAYGTAFRDGQAGINRPAFEYDLPSRWLPAIPALHERLQAEPPARVADLGCGAGWSTIALARAYPRAEIIGFDNDAASIEDARGHARTAGVRACFEVADARALAAGKLFDLVLLLEALHDMAQPAAVLAALRQALVPGGSVLVADERVAERFTAPGDLVERMMFGWSIVHCLPSARAEQPSAATGTAIRPETVRSLAADAGFDRCEVLPIENPLFRFYRLEVTRAGQ
jgi:2-polyprenyl-3-methyl-5-hydroxy-6-metoxy-1,4-benzoquinol methylase